VKVPNKDSAVVDERKVRDYLLSSSHPVGRYKARFFASLDYEHDDAARLVSDLLAILANEISNTVVNEYGTKYVVPGELTAPDGTSKSVVTVWIILAGEEVPRLVTAYPGDGDEN
jgi:hypothetical protein